MLKGYSAPSDKLVECNASFVNFTMRSVVKEHCVYELWKGETLIYIGCCYLKSVFTMPDIKMNRKFVELVNADDVISIVVKYVGDRIQCYNRRGVMLRQVMPECNRYTMLRAKMVIMCNEDGQKYRTQTEVCEVYGIHQGNLSAHLTGKPGFNTLAGRTFTRVNEDDETI